VSDSESATTQASSDPHAAQLVTPAHCSARTHAPVQQDPFTAGTSPAGHCGVMRAHVTFDASQLTSSTQRPRLQRAAFAPVCRASHVGTRHCMPAQGVGGALAGVALQSQQLLTSTQSRSFVHSGSPPPPLPEAPLVPELPAAPARAAAPPLPAAPAPALPPLPVDPDVPADPPSVV